MEMRLSERTENCCVGLAFRRLTIHYFREYSNRMASSIKPLDKTAFDTLVAQAPKQVGAAKLVFMQPLLKVSTPKLTQAWPIKPSNKDNTEKFTLETRLESGNADVDSFRKALLDFDMKVRQLAFENKKSWFGSKADEIEAPNDLRQVHHLSIHKGAERPDGSGRYDDTVRFQIKGWESYVDNVIFKGEGDNRYPVDVKWKSRLVDAQGRGGPDDKDTKFYICENRDMTTGKDQMAPWTPCQDPAGNQLKDAAGNIMWEFVGPKHCQPGCKLTIVFQPSMVWIAGGKFGVTLAAKQIFITPPPPKPKNIVDGIEIVDFVDPFLASRAAKQAMSSEELKDLDAVPPETDETSIEEAKPESVQVGPEVGTKRASESPAKATKGSKKAKVVHVNEEF